MKVIGLDIDDTLYNEIEYLKSAYREIVNFAYTITTEKSFTSNQVWQEMVTMYRRGENAFTWLNNTLKVQIPIHVYLSLYREHIPFLTLQQNIQNKLEEWTTQHHILCVITDGRVAQQCNKINALGLKRWVAPENILISECFGSEKPNEKNYTFFMNKFPDADQYVYIGDNPQKDFLAPNRLGWTTIGILDSGQNIHSQNVLLESEYLPQRWVKVFDDIILN
ncbi:MAG: HAD family hydrolase [Paludibacteraceae bacterium]